MHQLVSSIFGILGNILACIQYLTPVSTFYRIVKNKSTEQFECIPYICTVFSSSLWTYYGIIKPDYYVSAVNGFGAFVEAIYVILFLIYAPPKKRARTAIIASTLIIGLTGGSILVTYYELRGAFRTKIVGLICLSPMIAMYASPLSALETVLTTKSVEYMPFGLSFILFCTGGTWTVYATLVRDYFLGVPNFIGFLFGAIQLTVYCMYRKATPVDKSLSQRLIEEGPQHDPGVGSSQLDKKNNRWTKF